MVGSIVLYVVLLLVFYVLPIVHVARSDRTPPKARTYFIISVVLLGLVGYLIWWLTTMPPKTAKIAAAPQDGRTVICLVRSAFFGALVKYNVYVDDKSVPVAAIRGKGNATFAVDPGKHTLFVKGYRWLEFPFEAHAGDVMHFSLDTRVETALTNTVVGWI